MSKIGNKPIVIPGGVKVDISGGKVGVSGPKGELVYTLPSCISAEVKDGTLVLTRAGGSKSAKSLHGLAWRILAGNVQGVCKGWEKILQLEGTGYRAKVEGGKLVLLVGFSHPVEIVPPKGISFLQEEDKIKVLGISKQLVGQVAADIRMVRPPDSYKGKGVRYADEVVRKKPGKTVGVGEGAEGSQ